MTQEELSNIQELSTMEKLKRIYDILKPIFEEQEQQQEQKQQQNKWKDTSLDFAEICNLKHGARIYNILRNGCWGERFSFDKKDFHGEPLYSVLTIGDLLQVDEITFKRMRHAGKLTWESLNEYINKIKKEYDITGSN